MPTSRIPRLRRRTDRIGSPFGAGTSTNAVDAVVIGAGPNGLVAANVLADAGWDVLVLEAATEPGGAARSAQTTLPGFDNDLCSAFYPLGAASPVLRDLNLESYGLTWCHAPSVLAHVLPDDRRVVLSRDLEQTAASVGAFAAVDADAWRREFALWQRCGRDILGALLRPFPPVRPMAGLLRHTGLAEALRLARTSVLPVRRLVRERFTGEGAALLIAGNALHTDLGPDDALSGLFGWLLAMLGQDFGFPVSRGGAAGLTGALVRRLHSRGGRIECGHTVSRVLVEGNRAVGVEDVHGDRVPVARAVLADVPAPGLYLNLVGADKLPARLVEDLSRFAWDAATMKIDWALSGPIPWSAAEVAGAGTVHLGVDLEGLADYHSALARGRVPRKPFVVLGQMSVADPTRAPAGKQTAWAYTHLPRDCSRTAESLRERTEIVEHLVERHAPGFRGRILGRSIAGPADFEAENPSLVDGAINAGTSAMYQQLFFRPVPGLGRADTPIERLYLASASAHPGGGVHGAPGANAARAALAASGAVGPVYSAMVQRLQRAIYR